MPLLKIILLILGLVAFLFGVFGHSEVFGTPALFDGLALWIAVVVLDHTEGQRLPR